MEQIKLLDCTLREAPLNGLNFGPRFLHKFISGLEKTKIDFIEVGFLKDVNYENGSAIFSDVTQIEEYLLNKDKDIKYVALMDVGRFSANTLSNYDGKSVDGIRICFKKGEEREALKVAEQIREKGYLVFIQHVDTLGYSDEEIVSFINEVNKLNPYAYSIVDTFGAMYQSDVRHLYEIVSQCLNRNIRLGFHSHNNLMLANSNSQEFVRIASDDNRCIMVDASVLGCGRGAGNTHTELMMEFLNQKCVKKYDVNELLDVIDMYMPILQQKCAWGYSIPYFISGIHNAHVFNVKQLLKRHNIKSRDLRAIIELLNEEEKKKYDYSLLEKLYVKYFNNEVDDGVARKRLKEEMKGRKLLLLAPGKSLRSEKRRILQFILKENPVIIGVNNIIEDYRTDYLFFSGIKRFEMVNQSKVESRFIITSNIKQEQGKKEYIINYLSLIKYGWVNIDNSAILLLRLLISLNVSSIFVAGLDGYAFSGRDNFYCDELSNDKIDYKDMKLLNEEMRGMLWDVRNECKRKNIYFKFITESLYDDIWESNDV